MIQITDQDGNTYDTITIGNQVWLTENLHVLRYRNYDYITYHNDGDYYIGGNDPTYARFITSMQATGYNGFGHFYNMAAIHNPKGLIPEYCKIPDLHDVLELTDYLSNVYGNDDARSIMSDIMYPSAPPRWDATAPGYEPTNATGFGFLPTGPVKLLGLSSSYPQSGYGTIFYDTIMGRTGCFYIDTFKQYGYDRLNLQLVFISAQNTPYILDYLEAPTWAYSPNAQTYFVPIRCMVKPEITMML